jgi:hypothetical protein
MQGNDDDSTDGKFGVAEVAIIFAKQAWASDPSSKRAAQELLVERSLQSVRTVCELQRAVRDAARIRISMIGGSIPDSRGVDPGNGRLLAVHLDQVVQDGHAASDSDSHLSDMNAPRPILWIGSLGMSLLAWIPEQLIDEIVIAMECNSEQSFEWVRSLSSHTFVPQP